MQVVCCLPQDWAISDAGPIIRAWENASGVKVSIAREGDCAAAFFAHNHLTYTNLAVDEMILIADAGAGTVDYGTWRVVHDDGREKLHYVDSATINT